MTEASASVSLLLAATLDTLVSDVLFLISSDQMTRNKTLRKSVARERKPIFPLVVSCLFQSLCGSNLIQKRKQ